MPGRIQALQSWWSSRPAALRLAVEGGVLVLASAATAALPRIPQPASYHAFADQRSFLGIPHTLNTLSNAAMAVPAATGLWAILGPGRRARRRLSTAEAVCWAATCLCMMGGEWRVHMGWRGALWCNECTCPAGKPACVLSSLLPPSPLHPPAAAGSAYYHLQPNTERLAWDRLGMVSRGACAGRRWCCVLLPPLGCHPASLPQALTFASLNAGVVAERCSHTAGLLSLLPLQLAAAGSVAAWQASEAAGKGDLRAYLLVQGLAGAPACVPGGAAAGLWLLLARSAGR